MKQCQRLINPKNHILWDSRPDEETCGKPAPFQLGEEDYYRNGPRQGICIGYWVCAEHYDEYMNMIEK